MKRTSHPQILPFVPSEDEIQKCAYYLWQEEGQPVGRDLDVWLAAKERVRHRLADRPPRPGPRRRVTN